MSPEGLIIEDYAGDEPNDEGDMSPWFSGEEADIIKRLNQSAINRTRFVKSIVEEKKRMVESGQKLTNRDIEGLRDYAADDEFVYSVLKKNYDLYDDPADLDHVDLLNLVALRRYAEEESKYEWVSDVDELIEPYFEAVDLSDDVVESMRKEFFENNLHYSTVREGIDQLEDLVTQYDFWEEIENQEAEMERERLRYLYIAHPKISPSIMGYSNEEAPLIADGSGVTGKLINVIEKIVVTPSELRDTQNELESKIEEEFDELDSTIDEEVDNLEDIINENTDEIHNVSEDITGLKSKVDQIEKRMEERLDDVKDKLDNRKDQIDDLGDRLDSQTRNIDDLKHSLDSQTSDIDKKLDTLIENSDSA